MSGANPRLVVTLVIFTTAYCIQPLLVDGLKYQGAASASTFIYLIPHYLAMMAVGFLATDKSATNQKLTLDSWKKAAYISFIDIAHQLTEKAGLVYAGSAVYIIIGSSSIVWTAVFSVIILQRKYSGWQWLGLLLVCMGLAVKATSVDFRFENEEFLGIILTLTSSVLHGLTFVTNEKYLTGENALSGPLLVFMIGVLNSIILLIWTCVWTIPQWDVLITENIRRKDGEIYKVILLFLGMFLCGLIHSSTLWYLLKVIGAVSSGVIKGLKTASVFFLSHFLFCKLQSSQCLTPTKAASAMICVGGVFVYSVVTAKAKEKKDTEKQRLENKLLHKNDQNDNQALMYTYDNTKCNEYIGGYNNSNDDTHDPSGMHDDKMKLIKNMSDIFYVTNTPNNERNTHP